MVSIVALLDEAAAAAHVGKAGLVYYRGDGAQLREIDALLEAGTLRPPAVEIVPLAEAGAALARSKAGHVRGKIVLAVG